MSHRLGNIRVGVTDSGKAQSRARPRYYAFGLPLNAVDRGINKYTYNGKQLQPQTGLLDYGARQYDAAVGRWFGVDPLTDEPEQIDKSPYAAFLNNPLRFVDPDGRMAEDCCGDNGMSLVENVYWSTRDAVVSSIVTVATAIGSLFSNDIKPQKVNVSYSDGNRTLSKEAIPSDEVAGEVLGSALTIASAVPSGGSGGAGVFMAKTGTGTSTASSVVSAAKEAKGGVYVLKDGETVVRTGRTKDLIRREMEHANHPVLKKYEFETKHKTDNYAEQRGLEYKVSKQYESTASKANGGHNKINAINENNSNKPIYIQAAEDYLKRQ